MDTNELLKSARDVLTDLLLAARSDQFGWCEINLEQLEILSEAIEALAPAQWEE